MSKKEKKKEKLKLAERGGLERGLPRGWEGMGRQGAILGLFP